MLYRSPVTLGKTLHLGSSGETEAGFPHSNPHPPAQRFPLRMREGDIGIGPFRARPGHPARARPGGPGATLTPPTRCHQRLGPCPSLAVGSGRGDLSVWQRSAAHRGAAGLPVPRGWFPLAPSAPAGAARDTGYFESWCVGLGRQRGFGSWLVSSPARIFGWGGRGGCQSPGLCRWHLA